MTLDDVCAFLALSDALGVRVWLDGGWAVDCQLGRQSRPHGDLDVVVERRDVDSLVNALLERGYRPVPRDDTRAWNFVLGDGLGHEIDFHVIVLDDSGRGIYGPPENGQFYPAEALGSKAPICGRTVACTSAGWLIVSRTAYPLDAIDQANIGALAEHLAVSAKPRT
jgi:lincosamide nucleotidyltransferase A/C/D/E